MKRLPGTRRLFWIGVGGLLGIVLLATALIGSDDPESSDPTSSSSRETTAAAETTTPRERPQRSMTFTGNGVKDVDSFTTTASAWNLCARIVSGVVNLDRTLSVTVHEDASGDSVRRGELLFDGGNGARECTRVRVDPGRYYLSVSAGITWEVTVGP